MRLGEIIRAWRISSGAELRATARIIGINHTTLLRIERGEACDSGTLAKLFAWLMAEDKRGTDNWTKIKSGQSNTLQTRNG